MTAASVSDNAIGRDLLDLATDAHPTLAETWVDAGFKTTLVEYGATLSRIRARAIDRAELLPDPMTCLNLTCCFTSSTTA